MRNEKTERILWCIGTIIFLGCVFGLAITSKGFDGQLVTKIITVAIAYGIWAWRVLSRNYRNQKLLFGVRKENHDSIGDALQDKKILQLLKSAVYEFNAQNKERSITILESTWSQCNTYSDKAITGYLLSLFLYSMDEHDKASIYLEQVLGMRPYFQAALDLKEKIKYSQLS